MRTPLPSVHRTTPTAALQGRELARPWLVLALMVVTLSGALARPAAATCNLSFALDVTPRQPDDGAVVSYTITFCDKSGTGGTASGTTFLIDGFTFIAKSGVWTSCPTSNCNVAADGTLSIGTISLSPNQCQIFTFTLKLQAGLGGQQACLQGQSTVTNLPPKFPCGKFSDDASLPGLEDASCVTVKDPAPGCKVTATVTPNFLNVCAGSGTQLSAAGSSASGCSGGQLAYQWIREGIEVAGATSATYPIPPTEPAGGANYQCRVSCLQLPACQDLSNTVLVILNAPQSQLVAPDSACTGQKVDVYVNGGTTCTIDCGNGTPIVNSCFAQCTYATPGPYTVTGTDIDSNNCSSTQKHVVNAISQPVACIGNLGSVCEQSTNGPSVVTLGNCSSAGLNYAWTASLGTLDDAQAMTPNLTLGNVTVPTLVNLTLSVSAPGGCGVPDQKAASFTLLPAPTAAGSGTPDGACSGQAVTFAGTGSGSQGPYSYAWDFGDGQNGSGQTTQHVYAAAGIYTVVLTVTDAAGCAATTSFIHTAVGSCCPPTVPAVVKMLGVKKPTNADLTLSWDILAEAQGGYNVWSVTDKLLIPLAKFPGGGNVSPECSGAPSNVCVRPGAAPGPGDTHVYYQVHGLCGGNEGQ